MNELIEPQGSLLVVKNSKSKEFVASELSVSEVVSDEYEFEVTVLATSSSAEDWIGEPIDCNFYTETGTSRTEVRTFTGYVVKAQVQSQRVDSSYFGVKLTVQPWFFLLKHSRQCRVFQEASVQTIVTSIFDDLGFKGDYSVKSMPSTKREYCIQFNESDFDFVTRLLAEEGVHYYFGKDSKAGTLYLQQASKPFASDDSVTVDYAAQPSGDYEVLDTWQREKRFHSASLEIAGYDYNQTKLVTSKAKKSKYTLSNNSKLTEYRYPSASPAGSYTDLASALVESQRGQLDSSYDRAYAKTQSSDVCAGHFLKLAGHSDTTQKGNYLVSELRYEFDEKSGDLKAELTCIPEDQVFYPAGKDKPVLHGLQSALVSGSKDGEPANDALGRVRIKFHWDPESGDKTSCWVRVAQAMAGNGYGAQFLPRAGQEVLVSFINGDPDQPVIVSSVYNSKHKPPYPTANTTQSGVMTKLAGKANEIKLDDKKDNELFAVNAAKDMTRDIVNDYTETVGGEYKSTVTKNVTQTIEQKNILSAKEGIELSTDKSYALTAKESITGEGKTITLTADDTLTLKVGSSKIVISSDKIELSSGTVAISGSSKVSLDGGSLSQSGTSVSISSKGSLSAKASTSMSLSASTSFAAKGSTGAKIQGLNAELKGDVTAKVSGAATAEISSSGQTAVKGTIVMVN
ncbi:type IV secretion protein Rhs [Vibrio fortis]|uniref:Type IV secretion protein Rhs n=1 Tax=Vibrio fortis TaxID=212667 RepID=A0A066UNN2_9VIBR|nr:type VI secretion system tip protein TssI/VgrG [Vibrio fortis]KDN27502.1 type IV secretion protein Rhs [Vibrio fortis]